MGLTLEFRVCSISLEPFEQFSLNFTQMFISVSWCSEPINQPCKLKHKAHFKVTGFCGGGYGCPSDKCLIIIIIMCIYFHII